jgi:electron transport complex protein RnfD
MSDSPAQTAAAVPAAPPAPVLHVAPGPHLFNASLTTRRMMLDVLIGLAPILAMGAYVFGLYLLKQLAVCVLGCMLAEAVFTAMRRRRPRLGDLSAVVTGALLALSLPGTTPWYVGLVASFTAIGLGKIVFGGLGQNLFNPAMVGRAFVMFAFPAALGARGYVAEQAYAFTDAITRATPMSVGFKGGQPFDLMPLLLGTTNGSMGEVSAIACLLGGLYLCLRRTASWEIPLGVILGAAAIAGLDNALHPGSDWTALHHLLGGALLFGAFFIATDPVSSPLTPRGKFIFGAGIGVLVMFLRLFSSYPEGVMFSVLVFNSLAPLINRWTVPRPVGGPAFAGGKEAK